MTRLVRIACLAVLFNKLTGAELRRTVFVEAKRETPTSDSGEIRKKIRQNRKVQTGYRANISLTGYHLRECGVHATPRKVEDIPEKEEQEKKLHIEHDTLVLAL